MFISRKRFEAELDKVRCKVENEFYERQHLQNMERDIYKSIGDIRSRVDKIEKTLNLADDTLTTKGSVSSYD